MFGMGWQELAFIAFIALLLFGAKRLPEIGRSIGRAITAFKDGLKDGQSEGKDGRPGAGEGDGK